MKNLKLSFFAIAGALFLAAAPASAQTSKAAPVATTAVKPAKASLLTWTKDVHDFGDLKKSVPASFDFTFKNTTKETVLITNVKASCGCTATNYTKTPIKPGETASVTATYNAVAAGPFSKAITVTTNDSETPKILTIKGKVVEPQS